MKKTILIILNYYYPYISGVSEYARVLAEELVKKGHTVYVLTSNHAELKPFEIIGGVNVIRAPIICKVSKGTVSPMFILKAVKLSRNADVVNLHLPMIESGLISLGVAKKKIITTYHCDINMPSTFFNKIIVKCMDFSNNICLKRSRRIVVQTIDYAKHSRVARFYQKKFEEAATPIKDYNRVEVPHKDMGKKVIGFCGRLVEEKGLGVLLSAFRMLCESEHDLELLIGGDYENVAGGSIYYQLKEYIDAHHLKNVSFLGRIPEDRMQEFYSSLDVFVLPSINSLEAFGMVQAEAMFCGTPVVSTDLYGVRTVVGKTGMGIVVKKNNAEDLARAIKLVLQHPERYRKSKEFVKEYFGTEKCVAVYEKLIDKF